MQHKENSNNNNKMNCISLLLLLTPAVLGCIFGESKLYFFVYFTEDKSNDEANKIVKLLNAIPDDNILVIYPTLTVKCYVSFNKPQFGEIHERRVNETTRRFTLPIREIIASVSCPVSEKHKLIFLGIIRSLDLEIY